MLLPIDRKIFSVVAVLADCEENGWGPKSTYYRRQTPQYNKEQQKYSCKGAAGFDRQGLKEY